MSDVTRILSAIEQGDAGAAEQLLSLGYDELRKLAASKMVQKVSCSGLVTFAEGTFSGCGATN